jgi:hypothetical protein
MEASHGKDKTDETKTGQWTSMIRDLENLLELSKNLKTHLEDELLFKKDRDQFIEILQGWLSERQNFIDIFDRMKQDYQPEPIPLTEEEIVIRDHILELDKELKKLMILRSKDHHAEWRMVHQKGKSVTKYTRPYQQLSTSNGAFYDKRK